MRNFETLNINSQEPKGPIPAESFLLSSQSWRTLEDVKFSFDDRNKCSILLRTFLFIALLLQCSCGSFPLDDFNRIYPGMQKSEVLDVMGSPDFSHRFFGKDRWNYKFYDRGILFQKEVHFFEGSVIYAGDIYQPEVSAFQQDQINAKNNELLEQILATEYRAPASTSNRTSNPSSISPNSYIPVRFLTIPSDSAK